MKERELVAIIKSYRADSLGADDGALSNERAEAMDRYHGRKYKWQGEEGRSSVVSKDLAETVEWALPAIMKVFTQSGNIGEFEPRGPEDEELAEQESDAINKVFMQDCNGFVVLYDAVKDAMLLKNGYIKHYWCEDEKVTEEEYAGLDLGQLVAMMQALESDGAEVKVKGQEQREITLETPEGPQPMTVFDVRLQIKRKEGRVVCDAVPAEEVRVSRKCRGSLQESVFTEHVTRKTRSDLIEMGMPKAWVNELPALSEDDKSSERLARDSVTDESDDFGTAMNDPSMDELDYCEAYLKVDYDGDGVAELRKVVTVANRIPPGEYWNEQIDAVPITGGVMKRVPHRHVGESLQDEIGELAEIKTALFCQLMDNTYQSVNTEWLVNERVNLPDFLTSLPGGIKRIRGLDPIGDAASPVIKPPIIGHVLPVIDYVDGVKMARTGVNESSTGMDADVLKESTKGAFLENMNRASQKIEMITRLLAETLVKPTLLQIHALLIKHQDKPKMMKLRGKFVPVNPQEWRERNDLVLKVGLGTGNSEEKQQKLMMASQVQEKTAMLGLVGPTEGYNLAADLYKTLGFDMPEKYIIAPDPENPKWQEMQEQMKGKKDPLVQAEEVKGQVAMQKAQMDAQAAAQKAEQDAALEREKMQMEMAFKEREAQIKAETEKEIAIINARVEVEKEQLKAQYTVKASYAANPSYGLKKTEEETEFEASEKQQVASMLDQLAQAVTAINEAVSQLAEESNAPAEIIRGPDGKAAGVRKGSKVRQVVRGPDGRAAGLQ